MNITYSIAFKGETATVTTARCHLAVFGRFVEMTITSYCFADQYAHSPLAAITFGVKPISHDELHVSNRFAGVMNGTLLIARGGHNNRQNLEQELIVPQLIGEMLSTSDLNEGGVPAGRIITQSLLRTTESIFETIRQSIRKHLGRDVKSMAFETIEKRYGEITRRNIREFLGRIHWRLMLDKSGCNDDCLNVVEYATSHNAPAFYNIADDGGDIPLTRHAVVLSYDWQTIAYLKATDLLHNVCGEEMGKEFSRNGEITVKAQGYKFIIRPGRFVHCTDPSGETAELCVHTYGFACNPIDEMLLAYLHIKHNLAEYLEIAIAHRASTNFNKRIAA